MPAPTPRSANKENECKDVMFGSRSSCVYQSLLTLEKKTGMGGQPLEQALPQAEAAKLAIIKAAEHMQRPYGGHM